MTIIWSELAEFQLDDIYEYYQHIASPKVATKLVLGIINETKKLIDSPFIGKEEELLKKRIKQYRHLIFKNYKLIYTVDEENKIIRIADVFDTRQNPPKIKRNRYK